MNPAITKTLSLLLLLAVGLLLRKTLQKAEHHQALKVLILNIALPAIIFVALLNSQLTSSLIWLPVLAIGFNFLLLALMWVVMPKLYGIPADSPDTRTLALLTPSLAPGMSCFPFLLEYVGADVVALGAIADLGNKVYVLIFCYLVAMHWFFQVNNLQKQAPGQRLKALFLTLIKEPVNQAIVLALLLLGIGIHFKDLPGFLANPITMLSSLMTPIVLLFIGITVKFSWKQFRVILSVLLLRAGVTFCISGILLLLIPGMPLPFVVLAVVFPQSAVSFWPLAHISTVSALEKSVEPSSKMTFNSQLALNVLAVSLPFSAFIMLTIFSFGNFFMQSMPLIYVGLSMVVVAITPVILHRLRVGDGDETVKQGAKKPEEERVML